MGVEPLMPPGAVPPSGDTPLKGAAPADEDVSSGGGGALPAEAQRRRTQPRTRRERRGPAAAPPHEEAPLPPELERRAGLEGTDRFERKLRGANHYRQETDRIQRHPAPSAPPLPPRQDDAGDLGDIGDGLDP